MMSDDAVSTGHEDRWIRWAVLPDSGFEVYGHTHGGMVPLLQVDRKQFEVGATFRFRNAVVEERVVRHLDSVGAFETDHQRREAFHSAARFGPEDEPTDLASIPWFMRWMINTYGRHTLAAIIHDKLITDKANGGALNSDVVSDRFFREMMHACGVPRFLRWVVWTAVAMRSRWAAGGVKRLKMILWGVVAAVGITSAIVLIADGSYLRALGVGLAGMIVGAVLWGRQWGAAVIAAIALPLIAPAAVVIFAVAGVIKGFDKVKIWPDHPITTRAGSAH